MIISEVSFERTYYACYFLDGKKNVDEGTVTGKHERSTGEAWVDFFIAFNDGNLGSGRVVRVDVNDLSELPEDAILSLESYLSDKLIENQAIVSDLRVKNNVVEKIVPEEEKP
jgi:hypothetical protein